MSHGRGFLAYLTLSFFLFVSLSNSLSHCSPPLPSALPVNPLLIFLLTWTVMYFCFLNVLALPLLPPHPPSLALPSPALPPHLEKICLTNRRPGKLALLSFLSLCLSLSLSPTCSFTPTDTNTKVQICPHLCVCLFISSLGTG